MATVNVTVVDTKVFPGQKPGTSGLRKQVNEFMEEHYMENFIQCTLDAMGKDLKGSTLVVGGDGRYGVTQATDKIIKMAAANEVHMHVYSLDIHNMFAEYLLNTQKQGGSHLRFGTSINSTHLN